MNPPTMADGESALTPFQIEVARLFFNLPASGGFLLAGGAALLAQRLTTRPTQDLDFFTRTGAGDVPGATDALEEAAELDAGFDPRVLAQMMASLDRFRDSDIAVAPDQIAPLRQFYRGWRHELE